MNSIKTTSLLIIFLLNFQISIKSSGQQKESSYQYPSEPEVMKTLNQWKDYKFGLFIHWGTYSQWGIVESWSLCPEDREFTSVRPHDKSYFEYVKEYEDLKKTFNPIKFNPNKWAKAAKYAGMKYVVFTTKHHDGFNMFDTNETDYKITSEECPFSSNLKANITKEIFEAFRNEYFMTGAYYSISDWHHNDFWWDYFPPFDRNINYSPGKYPEKWKRFNDFIAAQLGELTNGDYGKVDLLWFDRCSISDEKKVDWPRFADIIRLKQPGAMMVARYEQNMYENYRTPEQQVPEKTLDYPWETCMTMGESWSYKPNDEYKSVYELVQLLVKIVSRGGNYLLNIGPNAYGDFDPVAYERLKGIGDWMQINGEAIYGTKPIEPFFETKLVFTQKDRYIYTFYLPDEDEKLMPGTVSIKTMQPPEGSEVHLLGYDKPLPWNNNGKGMIINIPEELQKKPVCKNAWVFRFQRTDRL
jgi:alpha-L-fucosidase